MAGQHSGGSTDLEGLEGEGYIKSKPRDCTMCVIYSMNIWIRSI